jgi:hypothetical protein
MQFVEQRKLKSVSDASSSVNASMGNLPRIEALAAFRPAHYYRIRSERTFWNKYPSSDFL